MSIRRYIFVAAFSLVTLCVVPSGVFANVSTSEVIHISSSKEVVALSASTTAKPTMKTSVLPDTASGSDDDVQTAVERQKTYDNINTLLIQSYKTKLDKILSDVYTSVENVAKDDPALQSAILEKIAEEIDKKVDTMEKQAVSPNRKKILSAIFSYLKTEILAKATELSEKAK